MRAARSRRCAGVTLIELLIAVTLVSLLSMGMLFAIRVGLNALERTNAQMMGNRRVLGAQRAIDQQISGMIPVTCGGGPVRPGAPRSTADLFFQGQPQSMRFVSSHSLEEASRGYARLLEYGVVPGQDGMGVRLIVNEYLYVGPPSIAPFCGAPGRSVEPGPRSFVLADRLARCVFRYQARDALTGQPSWQPVFAGIEPPPAIRIEMTPLQGDRSRLQMATLTVPVRVTRNPMLEYKDIEDEEQ
jgi:prepilin-type N-terminal cleavage/methylation domain-containing protein